MRQTMGTVRQFVRTVGSVRRTGRPSVLGAFGGAEGTQKRETHNRSLQALSPEMEDIFGSRLSKIWEGLKTFKKTAAWKRIIQSRENDYWLSRITEHIPENVKPILVSKYPPTADQLTSLSWQNTTDAGVLAWCSEPNGKQNSPEKKLYLSIGSASKYNGGLNIRKRDMLSESTAQHDEGLKRKVKRHGLNPKGEFKCLFRVPFDNGSDHEVMNVRALVVLARFVLMIWLGAVDDGLKTKSQDLVPWGLEGIRYIGLVSDNPLTTDLNGSGRKKGK